MNLTVLNQLAKKTGICVLFTLVLIPFRNHKIQADSPKWPTQWSDDTLQVSKIHVIWSNDQVVDTNAMTSSLDQTVLAIRQNPWFQGRLPENWGIFIDADWKLSSGFFSDLLKTPEGFPGVLFSPVALLDQDQQGSLITHELTHLMHQEFRPQEQSWVREGVAMMGEWKVTGFYNPALGASFTTPETSLTALLDPRDEGYADGGIRTAEYGQILQYFVYIYRLCGKDALLDQLLTSKLPESGTAFMDKILRRTGSSDPACQGFDASFRAFSIARFEQNTLEPDQYIILAPYQSIVRTAPLPLSPYSSSAYTHPAGQGCRSGDIAWGRDRCIEIRLK